MRILVFFLQVSQLSITATLALWDMINAYEQNLAELIHVARTELIIVDMPFAIVRETQITVTRDKSYTDNGCSNDLPLNLYALL